MKKACKTLLICILAILILALAQTLALLAGEASVKAGLPGIFEPVIDAVLYPVLAFFGLVHIIGNKLSVISIIQLVVAGTFVDIMFSLVEYQSGSFWNNAIIHALWNMSTIGLCHVGPGPDPDSVFTLVINTKNSLISGGDFGVESSIIAIAGYAIVSVIAFVLGRKCGEDRRRSC